MTTQQVFLLKVMKAMTTMKKCDMIIWKLASRGIGNYWKACIYSHHPVQAISPHMLTALVTVGLCPIQGKGQVSANILISEDH